MERARPDPYPKHGQLPRIEVPALAEGSPRTFDIREDETMRKLILAAWLVLPVAATAYHLGPGQDRTRLDDASDYVEAGSSHQREAESLAAAGDEQAASSEWAKAEEAFGEALDLLPAERVDEQRELILERAKCRMMISKLPEANTDLVTLVQEMSEDENADPLVLRDARRAMANSEYYLTWLMRLEGLSRTEWEPHIESARQTLRLLAESPSSDESEEVARKDKEDLEASVRLARMELSDLQGLPLPSQ